MLPLSLVTCLITVILLVFICSRYTNFFHTCIIRFNGNKLCKYIVYDINVQTKKSLMKESCILNLWNISHILCFLVLTLLFPDYFIHLFILGILWEITEMFFGHENWLDICWNLIGISVGLFIRTQFG